MQYRSWFSGIFGLEAERVLPTLFGHGELVSSRIIGKVAFGYLKRVDGTQPDFYTDFSGQVVLAADATLYNLSEIVATLRQRGLASSERASPGELLLGLYLEFGAEFAKHVRGMFTVAIWDGHTDKLILTRDAIGARSLYYAPTRSRLAFSSTLRSLRRFPDLKLEINLDAVRKYLTCAFVPGEVTLLEGIYELLPGHYLVAQQGVNGAIDYETRPYWQAREGEWDENAPVETYSDPLRRMLEQAVSERLPNNGAVGVLLSGGLDSSAITALTTRLYGDEAVHTYSISFGAEYPNELEFSSMVARHCGTRHRILEIGGEEIARLLPSTVALLDDPVGDPLTVPNFLLDRTASQDTDIVLNGEGGDPCFVT